MDFTPVQSINDLLADIHTENINPVRGKSGCGGQTDITKPDDTDFLKFHLSSYGRGFIFNKRIIQPLTMKFFTTLIR
jgi:hypothetical protein